MARIDAAIFMSAYLDAALAYPWNLITGCWAHESGFVAEPARRHYADVYSSVNRDVAHRIDRNHLAIVASSHELFKTHWEAYQNCAQ
jgi:hypothetical protein